MAERLILDDPQRAVLEALSGRAHGLDGLQVDGLLQAVCQTEGFSIDRLREAVAGLEREGLILVQGASIKLTRSGYLCAELKVCKPREA